MEIIVTTNFPDMDQFSTNPNNFPDLKQTHPDGRQSCFRTFNDFVTLKIVWCDKGMIWHAEAQSYNCIGLTVETFYKGVFLDRNWEIPFLKSTHINTVR